MNRVSRDRLYRAKRKDTGEWVKGNYVHYRENVHQIYRMERGKRRGEIYSLFIDVDPETIGEYTGCNVKANGKDVKPIYEGDILKVVCIALNEIRPVEHYTVEFRNGMFLARRICDGKIVGPVANLASTFNGEDSSASCSIVGNIYDDKKFIEKLKPDRR